jgi:nucleotide-binding universal stress UspA family protein
MGTVIHHEQRVLACVDQSHFAEYVTDYAARCAQRLAMPLELLHVLERHPERSSGADHSGAIGFRAQDALMDDLVTGEAAENREARERSRLFLTQLCTRAVPLGVERPSIRQRYGELAATLTEQEPGVELFVLGRRGASAESTGRDLGRNLESVVRGLKRPILAVSEPFAVPRRLMIAFDGSAITRRGVTLVASSPLFRGLACDVVMAGEPGLRSSAALESAVRELRAAGLDAEALTAPGDPEREVVSLVQSRGADLLVMGAYGHSWWHNLFKGSRTADLLRAARVPTLLLR